VWRQEVRRLVGSGRQEVLTTGGEAGERTLAGRRLAYNHLLSLT